MSKADHAVIIETKACFEKFTNGMDIWHQPAGIVDLYEASYDWIPLYDKSDQKGNCLAIGTSGNPFKTAPVAGCMMSELI